MRLAFDLDNTLIRCGSDFPLEKPQRRILARLLSNEQLRHGIKELTDFCRQCGWEVWVYTTSYRGA
jgi:phosphoserine phosphatase